MIPDKYSRFLPFERYTLQTTLSEEEITERLKVITRTTSTIQFSSQKAVILRANYDYKGEVSGNQFEIWRNINYRNSFLPIIKGTVFSAADKTEIRISMEISLPVKVFMIIAFSILTIVSLVFASFSNFTSMLIPVFILVVNCLILFLGFKLEVRISKKDLNTIFKAETN